jgi:uncharacterized protein YecE (DUF72 family)
MMSMSIQHYRLGCPIWSNRAWSGRFFTAAARPSQFLGQYSSVFNTVEGNNTFYGLPRYDVTVRWSDEAAVGFQFCFKFPQAITHELRLRDAVAETRAFFERLELLSEHLGPFLLQLPPSFGPADLPVLATYLAELPADFQYAVEVRQADFFAGGEAEQALNGLLQAWGVDRVILDSRALFSASPRDEDTREAQRRKPQLPVPLIATGTRPLVRFIGHPEIAANRLFLEPWVQQVAEWITVGRTPYIFTHTPNNRQAPELARLFHELLKARINRVGELPAWPAARDEDQGQLGLL